MNTGGWSPPRERGMALIIVLVFLVMLTLLGTAGGLNNTMEERMAGNTRNRDLAFEATEHALEDADAWIKGYSRAQLAAMAAANSSSDGVQPNGEAHPNDADYWLSTFNWSSGDLRTPVGLNGIAAAPRYVVERMPDAICPTGTCSYYRVTARGVGGVSHAVVILQAMYVIN